MPPDCTVVPASDAEYWAGGGSKRRRVSWWVFAVRDGIDRSGLGFTLALTIRWGKAIVGISC